MYADLYQAQQQLPGLQAIDYYLAQHVAQRQQGADAACVFHSSALTSLLVRAGHTCLDLRAFAGQCWPDSHAQPTAYRFPPLPEWQVALQASSALTGDASPLVLAAHRLYLRRFWRYEQELAAQLRARLGATEAAPVAAARAAIEQLFPATDQIDWQRVAAANALLKPLAVIAGGPGTGKTTTVTKLLLLLQMLADTPLRVALVAPTGKAAQRLAESVRGAKQRLATATSPALLAQIPEATHTLHRLLGVLPNQAGFRHHADNPLPYDLFVVDEVSMVDVPLMAQFLRAVPSHSRVLFLGDANQLPAVGVGSLLAELLPTQPNQYSATHADALSALTGMLAEVTTSSHYDFVTQLLHSHRFDDQGGIGALARDIIAGDAAQSWQRLQQADDDAIALMPADQHQNAFIDRITDTYYAPIAHATTPQSAFAQLHQFRLLVAMRQGAQGVETLNHYIMQRIQRQHRTRARFYRGLPLMVTANHYGLGLFNGDIGLVWPHEGRLQVAFEVGDQLRWVALGRMPPHEPVYAMTIHKTQGSEFNEIALLLPDTPAPLLSRELLYTAITRARQRVTVMAQPGIWKAAVQRRVARYSGLRSALFSSDALFPSE